MYEIMAKCPMCGKVSYVSLNEEQFERYNSYKKGNDLIQNCLPELSDNERELLKTGICSECWNELFGD